MIDLRIKLQASIFVDIHDITPSTDTTSHLMELFKDYSFLPQTLHEIVPFQGQRLQMRTEDNSLVLSFLSNRVDFVKTPTLPPGQSVQSLEEFSSLSFKVFEKVFQFIDRDCYRLALISENILEEMGTEKMNDVFQHFNTPLDDYKSRDITEWTQRAVTRIPLEFGEVTEDCNFITALYRAAIEVATRNELITIDRLGFNFDLNSSQNNAKPRFGVDHFKSFLQSAVAKCDSTVEELKQRIYDTK